LRISGGIYSGVAMENWEMFRNSNEEP
jgi:hypothetical protein